jgi:HK97 family phage major capsid protein
LLPSDAALSDTDETKQTNSKMENNIMSDEIKTAVAQAVAEALAQRDNEIKAEAVKAAEIKAAEEAGYRKAVEELKSIKPVGYHSTKKTDDDNDGVGAFKSWISTGEVNGSLITPDSSFTKAAWNVTTGATGGYLVPDPLYNQVIAKRNISSFVRIAPTQNFVTPGDHYLIPAEDTSMTAFVETAEGVAYDENEGTAAQKDIIIKKYTKLVKQTEEFLNFQGTNFDSWLMNALGRAEAKLENATATAVLYAAAEASGITTASATAITIPELASLVGSLNGGYNISGEAGFLMKNATEWYLKGVFGTNYYAFDGLFNMPAYRSDDMEAVAATKKAVLFGNFNFLGVAEKPGMLVQRNPYLYMATGEIGIFASIFRGYAVLQAEAFKTLLQHA